MRRWWRDAMPPLPARRTTPSERARLAALPPVRQPALCLADPGAHGRCAARGRPAAAHAGAGRRRGRVAAGRAGGGPARCGGAASARRVQRLQLGADVPARCQGPAVPRLQRAQARRRARPFPRARAVRPVLHAGTGDHGAVPGAGVGAGPLRGGRNRLAQARPAVRARVSRSRRAARAGAGPRRGAVRLHVHRVPERGAAPAGGHRPRGGAGRALLAAHAASQGAARAGRTLSCAAGRTRTFRRAGAAGRGRTRRRRPAGRHHVGGVRVHRAAQGGGHVPQPRAAAAHDRLRRSGAPARPAGARALSPDAALRAAIAAEADRIHPMRDGRSAQRVVAASEAFLRGELGRLRRKPTATWWRRLRIRAQTGYWGR